MASTLAAQLNTLQTSRVDTTSSLTRPEDLKKLHAVSLLFPKQHASTQDFDTIYSICFEGFQELCSLDPRFKPFSRSLFREDSKSVDREVLGKKDNEELDKTVKTFLELLGGWLLVRCGVKALEWLIRRFRIQHHNTSYLILTCLPYHQHPFFLKLLTVLPKDLPKEFAFLQPYRNKPGEAVQKSLLVQTLSTRSTFFSLLADYTINVVKSGRGNNALIRSWASLSLESLGAMLDRVHNKGKTGVTEEDIVNLLLPVISDSIDAGENYHEFQICAYMLLALLASRIVLKDGVLAACMETITSTWSPLTREPAIGCLALLAQQRQGKTLEIPSSVIARLLEVTNINETLLEYGTRYRLDKLATGICLSILQKPDKPDLELDFVKTLYNKARLNVLQKKTILGSVIDTILRGEGGQTRTLLDLVEGQRNKELLRDVVKEHAWDLEVLELRLGMVMIGGIDHVPPMMDDMEIDNSRSREPLRSTAELFQEQLQHLPKDIPEKSFLIENSSEFPAVGRAFLAAASKPQSLLPELYSQALFMSNTALRPSLLIKIWTGISPPMAKEIALRDFEKIILEQAKPIDYQAALPHLLVACSDSSRSVRKAAVSALASLGKTYQILDKKARKKEGADVWAFDTIYGRETDNVKWLSYDEVKKIFEAILANGLQECALDETYIFSSVGKAIGSVKNNLKQAFLTYLASHIASVPNLRTKTALLAVINSTQEPSRTQALLPVLSWWIKLPLSRKQDMLNADQADKSTFEEHLLGIVDPRDNGEGVKALLEILQNARPSSDHDLLSVSGQTIKNIWHKGLEKELKPILAKELFQLVLDEIDGTVVYGAHEALDILRDINLTSEIYEDFLVTALSEPPTTASQNSKRQKTAGHTGGSHNNSIRKTTVILELLEGDKPEQHQDLLGVMFTVLGKLSDINDGGNGGEYTLQVLLSCLTSIVAGYTSRANAKVDTKSVRADMLVNCIRSTNSPQVQNSALLLVAALTELSPEVVLHSVMPIFTFMGANTVRQDDEYSAYVIQQTIERVIPPLVKSLGGKGMSPLLGSAELLSSFVAAFQHIPAHRRLKLFVTLTRTLGPDVFLFAILALLGKKYHEEGKGDPSTFREFCSLFCAAFTPVEQINAVTQYLDVVIGLTQEPTSKLAEVLFSSKSLSVQEKQSLINSLLHIIRTILTTRKLQLTTVNAFASRTSHDQLKSIFSTAIEKCLELDHAIASRESGNVLEALLVLLPTVEFVKVVENLISRADFAYRKNVLGAFQKRVIKESRSNKDARQHIIHLLPNIAQLVSNDTDIDTRGDAILCLNTVTERFGSTEPDAIVDLAETIVGDGALRSDDEGLQILSLICLASMTRCLAGRIIPVLPKVAPFSLDLLEKSFTNSWQLHNAVYILFDELVKKIPNFMTSYLERILQLSLASASWEEDEADDEGGDDEDEEKAKKVSAIVRNDVITEIANQMEAKKVLNSVLKIWTLDRGVLAVQDIFTLVVQVIEKASKSSVVSLHGLLLKIVLQAFDIRRVSSFETEDVALLEQQCFKMVIQMIFKLNDTTFRPMFSKFLQWADEGVKEESGKLVRCRTFYGFVNAFLESLGSLVTTYYSIILDNVVELLGTIRKSTSSQDLDLWQTIIYTLVKSFTSDQDEFWLAPAQFDRIQPALFQQLENASTLPIDKHVTPAVVELAAAAQSEENFKKINNEILKKMRAEDAQTRLATVKLATELYGKFGEEWLFLLPETLPIISELMEDDDEDVERATQRMIIKIEEYYGEPLDSLLQ